MHRTKRQYVAGTRSSWVRLSRRPKEDENGGRKFAVRVNIAAAVALVGMSAMFVGPALADILPLKRGYYVVTDIPCQEASNADISLYTGEYFGYAHLECQKSAVKKLQDGSYQVTALCRDMQGEGPWQKSKSTYEVNSRTDFTVTSQGSRVAYRYCPQSDLPSPWHENDRHD